MEKEKQLIPFAPNGEQGAVRIYEQERLLKVGDRGRVLLVRDKETAKRYIYREFSGDAEVYRRLQTVHSPYLPEIFAVQEQQGRVQVLEAYIPGDSLAFLLEQQTLTSDQTRKILLQLCQALEAMHGVGAVHRDIKPENIILQGDTAVLIDFDVSRISKSQMGADTQVMGTTGYAAPEQYGFAQTDARADIYAMGVLMNEMLTGQHPSKVLAGGPLRPVIERCIEVNVDKRYACVQQLAADLTKPPRPKRRGKWLAAGAALLAVAVVAVLVLMQPLKQTPPVVETEPRELAQVSSEPWQGTQTVYETTFHYDLDGDGTPEEYRFGSYMANIPEAFRQTLQDNFAVTQQEGSVRDVSASVWKTNPNGSVEQVKDLMGLLEDVHVTLWKAQGNESALPTVYKSDTYGPGGIQVLYTGENTGRWFYEIQATLDGQSLSALSFSQVDLMPQPWDAG